MSILGTITTLVRGENENKEVIFPRTSASAVTFPDGSDLEEKFNSITFDVDVFQIVNEDTLFSIYNTAYQSKDNKTMLHLISEHFTIETIEDGHQKLIIND